ncbi:unnamed protein product [Microthlaspi erraticum]|uniref:Ubiquitin-like protease family profile domain-containing protein n=1 Tax=Microthlaspi erraticum TaxID=1685480 RepID=A0A6D2JGL9_9BRAS|nr:unnamed protein product [Microthlaspi erraticum]
MLEEKPRKEGGEEEEEEPNRADCEDGAEEEPKMPDGEDGDGASQNDEEDNSIRPDTEAYYGGDDECTADEDTQKSYGVGLDTVGGEENVEETKDVEDTQITEVLTDVIGDDEDTLVLDIGQESAKREVPSPSPSSRYLHLQALDIGEESAKTQVACPPSPSSRNLHLQALDIGEKSAKTQVASPPSASSRHLHLQALEIGEESVASPSPSSRHLHLQVLDIDKESPKTQVASPPSALVLCTPNFNLVSEESIENKEDKGVADGISDFQCLQKKKKRVEEASTEGVETNAPIAKKKKLRRNEEHPFEPRRSGREQIPSIHTQPPFTAERKKHPIFHPFSKVQTIRLEKFDQWKKLKKAKLPLVTGVTVDKSWFEDLEKPGMKISSHHMEAGVQLLRLRKENNPELFLNRRAIILGVKFLKDIDDSYFEFVSDKEGYQFETEMDGLDEFISGGILYALRKVRKYLWIGLLFDLEKRKLHVLNCAAATFSKEMLQPYVDAYAAVIPYIIWKISKDSTIDVRPFKIEIDSKDLPQVTNIKDSGVYILKS